MFGNLKSKLGDVVDLKKYATPQALGSLTGSRQRSSQHTPGAQTPSLRQHSRQPSDVSLSGIGSASLSYNTLLEQNENESGATANPKSSGSEEMEKEIERLKITLETQQDAALQKINDKENEWKIKLEVEKKKVVSLEEELRSAQSREEALSKRLEEADESNSLCNKSLTEKEDMEQKLVDLQDDYDQLEGLSAQEGAKVKHLLLNTTSDLEEARATIDKQTKEIEALTKRIATYEGFDERILTLSEEKMDLETQVAGLNQKLNAVNTKHYNDVEQYKEEIKHLTERITLLDHRTSHGTMENDEKNQALLKERENYEHKLEETRQQLNNIKASWSEKITFLETQIQNLNKKIAEDQVDLNASETKNELLQKQIEELNESKKSEEERHRFQLKDLNQNLESLKEDLETSKWQLETELAKKNQEIKELRRNLHLQEEKSHQLKEELEAERKEHNNINKKYKELNSHMEELNLKHTTLENKFISLQNSTSTLQEHLNRERIGAEAIGSELETMKNKYEVVSTEKSKLSSNLDKYLDKVNEYESIQKALNKEKQSFIEKVEVLEKELEESRIENKKLMKTVSELESDFDSKVERSHLVLELQEKLKKSEDENIDKKQMLKVQAQRLADMKKTIQRELKINPDSTDTLADTGSFSQLSSRLASDYQKTGVNSNPSPFFQTKRRTSESLNGDLASDFINLEYLKHVIIKFITSREYEAVQLTRAVSTLLHMSPDEESLLRETLEWKMSWFGSKPNIGTGQQAKSIPPSQ